MGVTTWSGSTHTGRADYFYSLAVPQGWQCPVCGRVYSPTTPMCYHCPGKVVVGTGKEQEREGG